MEALLAAAESATRAPTEERKKSSGKKRKRQTDLSPELSNLLSGLLNDGVDAITVADAADAHEGSPHMVFAHGGLHHEKAMQEAGPVIAHLERAESALADGGSKAIAREVRAAQHLLRAWSTKCAEAERRQRQSASDDSEDEDDNDEDHAVTGICYNFQAHGWCRNGDKCKFIHPRYRAGCHAKCEKCRRTTREAVEACSRLVSEAEKQLSSQRNRKAASPSAELLVSCHSRTAAEAHA